MRLLCFFITSFLTAFIGATRSLAFGSFSVVFSHTNLNSTLLAPYYHISDRLGCVVITNEVLKFIATEIINTFSPLAGLLDVEQQINTEPLQLTVC